jgi:dihydroneopterin aldolase
VTVKAGGESPFSVGAPGIWDASSNYLRIVVRDLVTEARVGLHAWEQHPERMSRLIVNVEMFATAGRTLASEHAGGIVDYDHIQQALRGWPYRPHTPLLETLLDEVIDLCFVSPRVAACRVSILKPDIFNNAAAVGVEAYFLRSQRGPVAQ